MPRKNNVFNPNSKSWLKSSYRALLEASGELEEYEENQRMIAEMERESGMRICSYADDPQFRAYCRGEPIRVTHAELRREMEWDNDDDEEKDDEESEDEDEEDEVEEDESDSEDEGDDDENGSEEADVDNDINDGKTVDLDDDAITKQDDPTPSTVEPSRTAVKRKGERKGDEEEADDNCNVADDANDADRNGRKKVAR